MHGDDDGLTARFPALPGQLAEARRLLGEYLRTAGLDADHTAEAQLAVNEAVGNAVAHAYRHTDEPGDIDLEAYPDQAELRVVVRDYGCGVPTENSNGAGLGLPLIRALADDVSVEHRPGQGTDVTMRFRPRT